jgi:hypothetical protein
MCNKTMIGACALLCAVFGIRAHAETVIPQKGQAPEQIQTDAAACQAAAQSADAASKQAYSACMATKGYSISP